MQNTSKSRFSTKFWSPPRTTDLYIQLPPWHIHTDVQEFLQTHNCRKRALDSSYLKLEAFQSFPSFPSLQSFTQVMLSLSLKHAPLPFTPSTFQPSFCPWTNPALSCLRMFVLPVLSSQNAVPFTFARLALLPHWDLNLNTICSDKPFLTIQAQIVIWWSAPTSLFKFPAQHLLLPTLIIQQIFTNFLTISQALI